MTKIKTATVLAISSGGGHWVQLQRLLPAFEGYNIVFASTQKGYCSNVPQHSFETVPDCNRSAKIRLCFALVKTFLLLRKVKPNVIITAGSAPGYLALLIGKTLGIKTIWIDSIANAEELSLSGKKAGKIADLWLTQWPHLARENGPYYAGNVIGTT